ncbi:MAG: hypothetical protein KME11_06165 [Timaviella obliquedivisa GSE-PSE-MK23-08B]|jgi:CRISPR-associated protein Cmr6|nr:hypothetical protein [Timaviella obliquedivisa GSE-PSE-MK23-08B]
MNAFAAAFKKAGVIQEPPPSVQSVDNILKRIPMMYRAQVSGRCSLQFAGNNQDLDDWTEEWTYKNKQGEACYQHKTRPIGLDKAVYRVQVEFPFRLFSNCGQDSIARPVIGKNGIPLLPGSSVKGLFKRACNDRQKLKYCGNADQPGELRFLGAYPVGNWAKRIVDVVHPQQARQLGSSERQTSANAIISFYRPLMMFEFSCAKPDVDWNEVRRILTAALQRGVGGKTSNGYGMGGNLAGQPTITPAFPVSLLLSGVGVSSQLRNNVPEFRPNLFKASLRGHVSRLLAGVCAEEHRVTSGVNALFGDQKAESAVRLIWQSRSEEFDTHGQNPTYKTEGILYLDAPEDDRLFIKQVLKFAFVMGGFGKSWRRVWHGEFLPDYHSRKFAIGCHWTSKEMDDILTVEQLKTFLNQLHKSCCDRLNVRVPQSLKWRESWHPERVAVYAKLTQQSEVIRLFHDESFKTTPAIGGKNPGDTRPRFVSSVWHRMLPVENQFLEIVTVFHGDRTPWSHQQEGCQLLKFVQELEGKDFNLAWGNAPKNVPRVVKVADPKRKR